jgi:hypothetical protein
MPALAINTTCNNQPDDWHDDRELLASRPCARLIEMSRRMRASL